MLPLACLALAAPARPLRIAPYLQLGADEETGARKSLTLLWFGPRGGSVTYGFGRETRTVPSTLDGVRRRAVLDGLPPGVAFRYAISDPAGTWFRSNAVSPPGASQSYRAVVMGDSGRGLPGQWRLAQTLGKEPLTLLVHTGDVVYPQGTEGQYLSFHFPVYNAEPGAARGIALLRRVASVATPGNHDTLFRSPGTVANGGLAYYRFWDEPAAGSHGDEPSPAARLREKLRGNFAFAWGPSWWVVLDANPYRNWNGAAGRAWIDHQLARGDKYAWRFVVFHQAAFHSSKAKEHERYMAKVADLFTKRRVDVVFSGHVHNYQRTYPLLVQRGGIAIQRDYGGRGKANGTIYVVTGAGGAELYDQMMAKEPGKWKPFTATYKAGYSFTRLEVTPKNLRLSQVGIGGKIFDHFEIDR